MVVKQSAPTGRRVHDAGRIVQRAEPDSSSPLATMPAEHRTKLFPVLKDGPRVVAELTSGRPPHRLTVLRWCLSGSHGVKLRTVSVGRCRHTSREWLVEFWQKLAEVRNAQ